MQTTKELRAELKQWLDANPDNTERNWLSNRCNNKEERTILENILNVCDERGIKYE